MIRYNEPVRIPIRRVSAAGEPENRPLEDSGSAPKGAPHGPSRGASKGEPASRPAEPSRAAPDINWQDKAMRLQAEMQTYRQRQRRWAEEEVIQEKARLLLHFLEVVDNLEQALAHVEPGDPAHQGIQVAYDGALQMLIREGVERIFAKGRVFDPDLHEAVAVVPATPGTGEPLRVTEVLSPGYRYHDRILRPAKVVVAK